MHVRVKLSPIKHNYIRAVVSGSLTMEVHESVMHVNDKDSFSIPAQKQLWDNRPLFATKKFCCYIHEHSSLDNK